MDPVELFIQSQQSFSLELLVNAHSRLCVVQLQKGSVTQEDALYCCKAQVKAQLYSELVIKAHVSLILESAISASMAANGQLKLSVTKDVIGNDSNFVSSVLAVLSKKCTGINYKGLEGFKKDALAYLHRLQELSAPDRPPAVNSSVESVVIGVAAEVMDKPISKPSNSRSVILAHAPFKEPSAPGNASSAREGAGAGSAVGGDKLDFERNESMARFLAQARRTGMDVLFPQIAHDKALAIIFVAVKYFATSAHRELIEMVIAVRDAGLVTDMEHVSKTKLRSVLSLLKDANVLLSRTDDQLFLAPGVDSMKELRERHDHFLSEFMIRFQLFIPTVLKGEVVWQMEEDVKMARLEVLDQVMKVATQFFSSKVEYTSHVRVPQVAQVPAATAGRGPPAGMAGAAGGRVGGRGGGPPPGRGALGGRSSLYGGGRGGPPAVYDGGRLVGSLGSVGPQDKLAQTPAEGTQESDDAGAGVHSMVDGEKKEAAVSSAGAGLAAGSMVGVVGGAMQGGRGMPGMGPGRGGGGGGRGPPMGRGYANSAGRFGSHGVGGGRFEGHNMGGGVGGRGHLHANAAAGEDLKLKGGKTMKGNAGKFPPGPAGGSINKLAQPAAVPFQTSSESLGLEPMDFDFTRSSGSTSISSSLGGLAAAVSGVDGGLIAANGGAGGMGDSVWLPSSTGAPASRSRFDWGDSGGVSLLSPPAPPAVSESPLLDRDRATLPETFDLSIGQLNPHAPAFSRAGLVRFDEQLSLGAGGPHGVENAGKSGSV